MNYGRFKAKAEKLVESSDFRAVTLRLANIYGPRQRTTSKAEGFAISLAAGNVANRSRCSATEATSEIRLRGGVVHPFGQSWRAPRRRFNIGTGSRRA